MLLLLLLLGLSGSLLDGGSLVRARKSSLEEENDIAIMPNLGGLLRLELLGSCTLLVLKTLQESFLFRLQALSFLRLLAILLSLRRVNLGDGCDCLRL